MQTNITGKPGFQTPYLALPREIFYGGREDARFIPGPVTLDGTLSGNPLNTPYVWQLWAGQLVGRVTASGKYATSILGTVGTAYTSGGTTLATTIPTATELARRIGSSGTGTFKVIGPPTAGGTVASTAVTYSAVDLTTGNITVTSLGVNKIAGSFITPADGSETIVTVIGDINGLKVSDQTGTIRLDVYDPQLWAGGGILNTGYIVNYPADTALIAWLKAAIRVNIPDAKFQDDLINT